MDTLMLNSYGRITLLKVFVYLWSHCTKLIIASNVASSYCSSFFFVCFGSHLNQNVSYLDKKRKSHHEAKETMASSQEATSTTIQDGGRYQLDVLRVVMLYGAL